MTARASRSLGIVTFLLGTVTGAQAANLKGVEIADEFPLERCAAVGLVTSCFGNDCNEHLPLIVGRLWELDNANCDDCDEPERVEVEVLSDTQVIDPAGLNQNTRVVVEREWIGEGVEEQLSEVSRNFLNQCPNTQDIYYWGEEVCVPEGSEGAADPPFSYATPCPEGMEPGGGAWKVGVNGALPGILFPGGAFLPGARYFQELAENARDWAENVEMGLTVDDPNPANGEFEDCVLVVDRNALEDPKGKEGDEKVYCPGIGLVRDEDLELTSCTDNPGSAPCTQR
jgi:hypothetical protein